MGESIGLWTYLGRTAPFAAACASNDRRVEQSDAQRQVTAQALRF